MKVNFTGSFSSYAFPWQYLHRNYTKVQGITAIFSILLSFFPPPLICVESEMIPPLTWSFFLSTWHGAGWLLSLLIWFCMFFSVWLCVHIRWLAWPSCYTTLAWVRHCFPSHYPRSGQRSLQGGDVTRRIACWTFQDGHLVSFDLFFSLFWFVSFHTLPCCPILTVTI